MHHLIIGITGASGVIYGIKLLAVLKELDVHSHVIITKNAEKIISIETDYNLDYIKSLATFLYDNDDMAAPIASGSYKTRGMVVAPCSVKTLSGIASGYSDNLLLRAADVCIKEKRKLTLVIRETPLNQIHLENMLKLAKIGVQILPASPPFYGKPTTINDLVDHIVGRILDTFGFNHQQYNGWGMSINES